MAPHMLKTSCLWPKKRGLGCVAITDHNTTIGNLEARKLAKKLGIILISGMELSTLDGEILCYGIEHKIEMGLSAEEAVKQIHKQGGIAVIAHPFNPKHPNPKFARIDEEIFTKLDVDGIEVFDAIKGRVDAHFLNLAEQKRYGITGGSDAHVLYQLGKGLTIIPDHCKTEEDVIQAIKNRHTYVTGLRINYLKMATDVLWCNTLGRFLINRFWGLGR